MDPAGVEPPTEIAEKLIWKELETSISTHDPKIIQLIISEKYTTRKIYMKNIKLKTNLITLKERNKHLFFKSSLYLFSSEIQIKM